MPPIIKEVHPERYLFFILFNWQKNYFYPYRESLIFRTRTDLSLELEVWMVQRTMQKEAVTIKVREEKVKRERQDNRCKKWRRVKANRRKKLISHKKQSLVKNFLIWQQEESSLLYFRSCSRSPYSLLIPIQNLSKVMNRESN
jgi:hypothetical protein